MDGINFPFAKATVEALGDAATYNVEIKDTKTILRRTGGLGQAVTGLSLKANRDLLPGSEVIVDITQGATGRNVTFGSAGTAIVAPALTGVTSDRDTITLVYDGTSFVAKSVWQKIFDAA